ncbi:hypothetical protein BWI96_20780 [Siphonobacter sp. SORGH_AS_0500]|uniref:hypothetical protein n=1 Tax=Siphonobacter sp. SORGH_AS_0500 TaxID=1864824 RepID=UPI000CB58FD6|nr:hypothetical protein [Siphonobacter sp. SORGH_AS_0500]PKK34747.1 hypothetical protein BWI96_20780 [Siphonobacter sp. SORGH_AS_0500]
MRPIRLREERDFSEIINVTFQFTFQNLRTLGPVLLYFAAPFSLISGIATGLFQSQLFSLASDRYGMASSFSTAGWGIEYLLSMLFNLLAHIVMSLVVSTYLVQYLNTDGPIEPADIWRVVSRKLLPALGMYILYGLSLLLGAILCFLPVVYPYTVFSMGTISMVQEDLSPIGSLQRSQELAQLSWSDGLSTFGIRILVTIAASFLGAILSVPMYLIMFLQGLKVLGENLQWIMMLTSIISVGGAAILGGLVDVALGFQYFSLVEKKEGIGLMEEISQIGIQTRRDEEE